MATQDPDLKLRVEWDEVRSAFIDAKKRRDKDPEAYAKAKKTMGDMRRKWRAIGEATGARVPTLSTIETRSEVNK